MNRLKESYEPKVVNGIYNGALMNLDDVRKSLPNNTPREIWNLYQELFDLLEKENDNSAIEKQADSNISDGTFTIYIQSVEAWAKEYKPLEGKTIPIYNVHRITEYEESICGVVGCDYCGEIMANDYTLLLPFSEKKINSKIPVSYEWINIGFIRRKQPTSNRENKQNMNMKDMKKSKQVIKLNESRLRSLIKDSIKRVLMENVDLFANYYQGYYKDFNDYVQRLYDKLEYEATQQGIYSVDDYVKKITDNKYKTFNDAVTAEEWRRYRNDVQNKQRKVYDPMAGHNTDNPNYVPPIENVNVNDTIYPGWSRPYGYYNDLLWKNHDKEEKEQQHKDDANMKRMLASADKHPLHRKGSLNRGGNVKLNESRLRSLIKESIKKVLKESTNNPIILGDESDGYLWYVEFGDGGYESTIFNIYAQNEQDALDSAVDYCEQQGWNGLFWDDDEEVTKYEDDFITAGNSGHYLRIDCFIVRRM